MRNSPIHRGGRPTEGRPLSLASLSQMVDGWLLDGEIRNFSKGTLALRRFIADKLLWFLRKHGADECGVAELRRFFAYLQRDYDQASGGRWGDPRQLGKLRPATVATFYRHLRTLFNFIVSEGELESSPIEDAIPPPIARSDQIIPFTDDQVQALIRAAKKSRYPRRDEAIVLFLLDTGARASEVCGLRVEDVDIANRRAEVLGKGGKKRMIAFSGPTAKALWAYIRTETREPEDPLFASERGIEEPLTRWGLLQLVERLGKAADIRGVRCSPHTFRHTFSISFLRAGGNQFTLMSILGHTQISTTNRYVALAEADIAAQHRQFSPVARLLKGKGK